MFYLCSLTCKPIPLHWSAFSVDCWPFVLCGPAVMVIARSGDVAFGGFVKSKLYRKCLSMLDCCKICLVACGTLKSCSRKRPSRHLQFGIACPKPFSIRIKFQSRFLVESVYQTRRLFRSRSCVPIPFRVTSAGGMLHCMALSSLHYQYPSLHYKTVLQKLPTPNPSFWSASKTLATRASHRYLETCTLLILPPWHKYSFRFNDLSHSICQKVPFCRPEYYWLRQKFARCY